MKTKLLISESEYNNICEQTEQTHLQNHAKLYFNFGTYGASLENCQNGTSKHINDFRKLNYYQFCKNMDLLKFE